jgi:hypothetical protein
MRRKITLIIPGMVLLSVLNPVMAQTPVRSVQYANTISLFIDNQTFAVARLDVSGIDVEAFINKVLEFLPQEGQDEITIPEEVTVEINAAKAVGIQWQQVFLQAGGKDIYGVYSMNDFPYFFIAVPLQPSADVPMLKSWLATVAKACDVGEFGSEQIGNFLVAGRKETVERVKTLQTTARPELTAAFAAAGDATVQLLILPIRDQRRVIEEMMPNLPLPKGEVPSSALTRGITWAAVGVNLPPQMSLGVRVKSQDAQAAQNLKNLLDQFYAYISSVHEVQQLFPNMKELLQRVTPTVKADRLELALTPSQTETLIQDILKPMFVVIREEERLKKSLRQLRQILVACITYADDHQDQWPENLQVLVEAQKLDAKLLHNPRRSQQTAGYVYIRPGLNWKKFPAARHIVLYEPFDEWPQLHGVWIGLLDGHVERAEKQERLEEMIAEAKARNAEKK